MAYPKMIYAKTNSLLRQNLRVFVCNQQTVTTTENFFCNGVLAIFRIYFFLSVTGYMVTNREIIWNDATLRQL